MRASGPCGELRYGYQVAARLGPWVIARDEDARYFTFSGATLTTDEVWLAQRPLDLVLALGSIEWVWRDIMPTIVDGRVTLELTRRPDVAGPRIA